MAKLNEYWVYIWRTFFNTIETFNNLSISVTRLGDFSDFGQLFKAFGNNQFAQISHILRQFL